MDKKTSAKADEPSAMHLSPLESKSQAEGKPKDELIHEKKREQEKRQHDKPL